MERKVLFLSDTRSFLVNTIVQGIEEGGFEVELAAARPSSLATVQYLPPIVMLYFQESPTELTELLTALNKRVNVKGIRLYIMGDPEELRFVYDVIPMDKFSGIFFRPVNVKEVVTKLNLDCKEEQDDPDRRKRILIVDDNPTTLRMMNRLFATEFDVTMANSGMNAITYLSTNYSNVDLILLDYEMPIVNGAQVYEMLQSEEHTKNIPVMFLTGKSDRETVTKAAALKPVKYLLKSMPPEELFAYVKAYFDAQRDKILLNI